jgi:hypothetical protein
MFFPQFSYYTSCLSKMYDVDHHYHHHNHHYHMQCLKYRYAVRLLELQVFILT